MTLQVRTLTAETAEDLAMLVDLERKRGWFPVARPTRVLFDGKAKEGRPVWQQSMERRT